MDQTRYATVEVASVVKQKLTLGSQQRVLEGQTFTLELEVPISYEDDVVDSKFALIAERVKGGDPAFVHANNASVYTTWAQVEPNGDAFRISIEVPAEGTDAQPATVYVASDMERIVHEFLARQDRATR